MHPNPQRILTVATPLDVVLRRLVETLPDWAANRITAQVTAFAGGTDGHITVRASGTETVTRLYIEAPAQIRQRLARAFTA